MLVQICNGMEYLVFQKIVHRDLAARNCLMSQNYKVVKISDFGLGFKTGGFQNLTNSIDDNVYYYEDNKSGCHLSWTALECLKGRPFTEKSDVWSFGVLIWEVLSRKNEPYQDTYYQGELIEFLTSGRRLEKPYENCTETIYGLMLSCWNENVKRRPTFTDVFNDLVQMRNYIDGRLDHKIEIPEQEQPMECDSLLGFGSFGQEQQMESNSSLLDTIKISNEMLMDQDHIPCIDVVKSIDEDNQKMPFNGLGTFGTFKSLDPSKFTKYIFKNTVCSIPKRYQCVEEIGSGSQGIVSCAYDTATDTYVAIKKLTRPFESENDAKYAFYEFAVLDVINHRNVTKLLSAYTPQNNLQDFNEIYFVTEYMSKNLRHFIEEKTCPFQHSLISQFIFQILSGLKYLNQVGIIHRDLKPENIVIGNNYLLKIIDYGLSINQSNTNTSGFQTTEFYQAPETLFKEMGCCSKVDIWSVGCIFAELIKGEVLFYGRIPWLKILETLGTPSKKFISQIKNDDIRKSCYKENGDKYEPKGWKRILSDEMFNSIDQKFEVKNREIELNAKMARKMIKKMLKIDPKERCTVDEALQNPYVNFWKQDEKENVKPIKKFSIDTKMTHCLKEWKELIYNKLQKYAQTHDVTVDPRALLNLNCEDESDSMTNFNKLWNFFTEEIDGSNIGGEDFKKIYGNPSDNFPQNQIFINKACQFKKDGVNFEMKTLKNNGKVLGFDFPTFSQEFDSLEFKLHDIYEIYLMQISNAYNENQWSGKKFNYVNEKSLQDLNTFITTGNSSTLINVTSTNINIKSNGQLIVDLEDLSIGKISVKECDKYFYFKIYPSDYTNHLTHFCLIFVSSYSKNICNGINWNLIRNDTTNNFHSNLTPLQSPSNSLPNFPLFSDLSPIKEGVLFKGFFNTTYLYTLQNPQHIPTNQVSVKELDKFPAYLREVKNLLICEHQNVVKCFGCYQDFEQYYFVMEYLKGGTLKDYLMDPGKPLSISQSFNYLHQILNGMCYLSSHKIMHRYLAACNCFLTHNYKTLKIGEFVLSRQPTLSYRYNSITAPKMPYRWMALDFLLGESYHEKADVWSFAVLMWEIFTRGQQPYQELKNCEKIIEFLKEGKRLKMPENCPQEIYNLMLKCWSQPYFLRPTFEELKQEFSDLTENFDSENEETRF